MSVSLVVLMENNYCNGSYGLPWPLGAGLHLLLTLIACTSVRGAMTIAFRGLYPS